MHNNYYFLRKLSGQLNTQLAGYTVAAVFSQSKDELILEFHQDSEQFFIRAHLRPQFSCLSFPEEFSRARKNSVDLFPEIIGASVLGVHQFKNERSFALNLKNEKQLLFKMHGNQANVVLFENQKPIALFKNEIAKDLKIDIGQIDRDIDWSKPYFIANRPDIRRKYFTWGKDVWQYLDAKNFDAIDSDQQWKLIEEALQKLEQPGYHIIDGDLPKFTLLPLANEGSITFSNPIKAINEFFTLFVSREALFQKKSAALKNVNQGIKSATTAVDKYKAELNQKKTDTHFRLWGDLIMAHLHEIQPQSSKVILKDFTDDEKLISIKLNPERSPQKNAENYYRKAKNQEIEINKLEESVSRKDTELKHLLEIKKQIGEASNLFELRKIVGVSKISFPDKKISRQPFIQTEFKGFRILIGRSAADNDELTLKHSYKDDLWFHAKDVSGSHVLVKYQSGKNFPKDVIERAAELAAYYSKRKNESLCPVAYTEKKYVRKRKGDPAGLVIVEKEKVILVEPKPIDA